MGSPVFDDSSAGLIDVSVYLLIVVSVNRMNVVTVCLSSFFSSILNEEGYPNVNYELYSLSILSISVSEPFILFLLELSSTLLISVSD
jgi:hypothetical protein